MNKDEAVVVALGSNQPYGQLAPQAVLEAALGRFPAAGLEVVKRSSWWRSTAWPNPSDPEFLNGVALVQTAHDPSGVLQALLQIEAVFGRNRRETNAPRTLDLDLIAHGRIILNQPGLELPHPRALERRFVMGPLAQVAPRWKHPGSGVTAADLAAHAPVGLDARPM